MIEELIASVARRGDLEIGQARELAGRLLTMAEAALGPEAMHRIVDPVEGAGALMRSIAGSRYDMSEVGGTVGGALTGRFGGTAGPAWVAEQVGLPEPLVRDAAHEVARFFGAKVGPEAEQQLMEGLFPPEIEDEDEEE
jgi:hypothetical protein